MIYLCRSCSKTPGDFVAVCEFCALCDDCHDHVIQVSHRQTKLIKEIKRRKPPVASDTGEPTMQSTQAITPILDVNALIRAAQLTTDDPRQQRQLVQTYINTVIDRAFTPRKG